MGYNKNKYLAKNTFIFAIGNIGTKLINFIMVPFYSHILSRNEYGTIDLVFTILSVIIPIVTFNICEAVQRFSMDNGADYSSIFSNSFIITLIGALVSILSIPISNFFLDNIVISLIIYIYIVAYSLYMITVCFLRGREQLIQYSICNLLLTALICVFNIIFLVYLKKGMIGYFASYALAYIVVAVIAFFIGKEWKFINFYSLNYKFSKYMISFSIALVPNALLWWIVNSSDRIMLSSMYSVSENGIYAMAYKLPSLLSMMSTIFMQAWGFSAVKEFESQTADSYQNKVFEQLISIMSLVAIAMLLVLKPAIKLLLANDYYDSWKFSPFLIAGAIFVSLASFVGTIYYVTKDSKRQMFSAVGGAIVNIILNFVLIPVAGGIGAAIATCISYLTIFLYRFYDTKGETGLVFFNKRNVCSIILMLISVVFIYYKNIIISEITIFLALIIMLIINRQFVYQIFKYISNLKNYF